ncbi:MAG: hypothetical protein FGM32_10810 [Candidatus Kapabacteria bacterium]|nr:hypothetical protein [Candidatus Kapabacteria bacterium]
MLEAPKSEVEIATALNITPAQVRMWLQRLVSEGLIDKGKKSKMYSRKQSDLFAT